MEQERFIITVYQIHDWLILRQDQLFCICWRETMLGITEKTIDIDNILESKMGPELAYNMMAYAKNPPLSLEDVVNGEYSNEDIPYGHDARLALTLSLRHADGRQIGRVKQFIRKYLGSENEAIFDSLWIGENDEKALQIAQQNQLRNVGR